MTSKADECEVQLQQPDPQYPLKVEYCGECSLPPEYCEFGPSADRCKEWLKKNLPQTFTGLHLGDAQPEEAPANVIDGPETDDKKRQKRGGKGLTGKPTATGKKGSAVEQRICLSRAPRGKNKFVTVVSGLSTCGIELKVASKFFAQRFACGSSVTGPDEIVIQGDVKDDLLDILPEKWAQIDEENIEDLGDAKR